MKALRPLVPTTCVLHCITVMTLFGCVVAWVLPALRGLDDLRGRRDRHMKAQRGIR